MKSRVEIKKIARTTSKLNLGPCIGAYLIFAILPIFAVIPGLGIAFIFVYYALSVSYSAFNIDVITGKELKVSSLFDRAFDNNFLRKVGALLYRDLFIFLWSLLLVVPGIIKFFSYFMAPYILALDEDVKATDVIKLSKIMMKGHKWDCFVLYLSFLGWEILGGLTAGILSITFVGRYENAAFATFAMEVREDAIQKKLVEVDQNGHIIFSC